MGYRRKKYVYHRFINQINKLKIDAFILPLANIFHGKGKMAEITYLYKLLQNVGDDFYVYYTDKLKDYSDFIIKNGIKLKKDWI